MNHLFILNPAAGSRDRTEEHMVRIQQVCEKRNLSYRIAVSGQPGDCGKIAREAAQSGEEYRIYSCGGDGTLNEIVNGVAGYENVAVTMFTAGSGNDFVKNFDEPDAFGDLERLMDSEETVFDLIRCNEDYALNICSVGLDARIGADVSRYKRLPLLQGFRAYLVSTVVNVIRGVYEHYVLEINGERMDADQTMICVCNGRFYGGGFNPVPEAEPDDGVLDVLLVNRVSRLQVPFVFGRYKNGQYRKIPRLVRHFQTKSLQISCEKPTPVNLDGEIRMTRQMDIRLTGQTIRFFYPRGLTWTKKVPAGTL